tara:strand:- start:274 stop:438 length:165 start_codon:yes stop_codon:yes gene_type:complete
MDKDYFFLMNTVKHPENKRIHIPALKNLIALFQQKWPGKLDRNMKFLKVKIKNL